MGGFRYFENGDETFEYPPVVLTLGTGGYMGTGYLANQDWKSLKLLKDIRLDVQHEEEEKEPIEDVN
jgi:hypothetical protein